MSWLSDADRQALIAVTQRTHAYPARTDIVADGGSARSVVMVCEGWACRHKQLEDGRRQILSFYLPGDMCDPLVFLLGEMTFAVSALTPVKAVRVSAEEIGALIRGSVNLERAFWRDMLVSAEIQREWTVGLGRRSAIERMAHLFCEIAYRLQALDISDGAECEMPVTQPDLGDALGLSSVHVSRTLQELRSAKLVELKEKRLVILDQRELRSLAMFDPRYLHLPLSRQV